MKIKILQWNIWCKEDPVKISNEILKIDPDIACLQELKQNLNQGIDFEKTISEITKYKYFYKEAATWDKRSDVTSQGNAILSKYPISASRFEFVRPFKHNPANATKEGRVYLETDINVGRDTLTVGTIHMPYAYKFRNTKVRRNEADKLCGILSKKSSKYVFTGDLNSTPNSYTVNSILTKTNLKNAGPDFDQNTWTTKPFNYHGFVENSLDWRIDYVFASNDVKVINSEIVKTELSDHLPILIEIEI
jgi:endonuclease/exonuclease/phosphatase family metal-dependent hydrolase